MIMMAMMTAMMNRPKDDDECSVSRNAILITAFQLGCALAWTFDLVTWHIQ